MYRGNPPSQAAIKAIEQVQSYVRDMKSGAPELLHPISDLKINDFEIVQKIREGEMLRKSMEHFDCTDDPQFEKHVSRGGLLDNNSIHLATCET